MKKSVFILALLAIIATGAFAQEISMAAGGGLLLDWNGNNGGNGKYQGYSESQSLEILSFGGFAFFDATYAELDVSFAYGSLTSVTEHTGVKRIEDAGSAIQLGFTLLGKYPLDFINLGDITLFPLLGADYNMWLSAKNRYGVSYIKPGDNSQFGILAGVGLDFPLDFLSDALFLRAEAMFHLRFPSKATKDAVDAYRSQYPGASIDTTFGVGPRIKIGVGYRF